MAGFSSKRRKIRQPDSEFPLLKCHKTQNDLEDWIGIGKLPDEILVSILSLLPMKQAIRTSVLARRWRYLWTSITHLEFDDLSVNYLLFSQPRSPSPTPFDMCAPLEPTYPPFLVKRRRFVDWVNQVLNLHKGSHVEEFSLEFSVYGHYFKSDIDSWINFAFQKRVKRLHLIFTCTWASTQRSYTLTPPMLCNYRLDSLVQLRLCYVEVTGEVLECFLSACPLLEFLSVSDSHVMNFKISGPSLKLKQLEITYCTLTSLDIYAVNLMSFKYVGNHECISWKHTPPLVNAHFGGPYASYIIKSFFQFQSYLSQLETLVLDLGFQKLTCFPKLPKLRNLKQLELQLNYRVFCLLLCTSLLRASPSLNRFKIKFFDLEKRTKEKMEIKKSKCKHKCLKVVKLSGFVGCGVDLEIARYILSHTLSLEKIIINPRHPFIVTTEDTDEHLKARSRARQHLEHILPQGTQLVVL
ncbi:F-box/FBD/LRR-repeat protein At1g13570-like isoform X2 [Quercus robur]|uniref:F-box/FBD/LRR-repeat protein At1g13570-like isoform X1 n=2 Tax=Quercus robur TaxID=38942 RepID=UPI002163C292|nr:F-box/FBD/LRR-repeat protein At1g13570-like isoform X1 [Quercus robur]XP_050274549.1 F-box/FBD/LRR-repeat protein At1g13570-like isoform X2 [Quercus robur]